MSVGWGRLHCPLLPVIHTPPAPLHEIAGEMGGGSGSLAPFLACLRLPHPHTTKRGRPPYRSRSASGTSPLTTSRFYSFLSSIWRPFRPLNGLPIGCPWIVYGLSVGCLWATHGLPTGCPRGVHGLSVGRPWVTLGLPLGCLWDTRGLPLACLPMGCLLMGCL